MKRLLVRGFLVGLIAGIGLIALSKLGNIWFGLPYFPDDIFQWQTLHLPGSILTFFIGLMVRTISSLNLGPTDVVAKQIERTTGLIELVVATGLFGLAAAALAWRFKNRAMQVSLLVSLVLGYVIFAIEGSLGFPQPGPVAIVVWIAALFLSWGTIVGVALRYELAPEPATEQEPGYRESRRKFLAWLGGGVVALVLAALGFGRTNKTTSIPVTSSGTATPVGNLDALGPTSGPAASPALEVLKQRIPVLPDMRKELTSTHDFYRIDINTAIPFVDEQAWRLKITGLVDQELSLSLADLKAMPSSAHVITQECISNYVGGDLISTARYVGVQLKEVLAKAGIKPDAKFIKMHSFDSYYESMPMSEAQDERTLLVYGMNNDPLPPEHGAPVRISIPGHYGMKQPKWLDTLTLTNVDEPGFWVDRGWTKQAVPYTISFVDTVSDVSQSGAAVRRMAVGGEAYSGERGISKVEVQLDNGPWQAAQLRLPPLSPLAWVQWRFDQDYASGRHTFRVRAYDSTGQLQPTEDQPPEPLGATGLFTYAVDLPE